MHIYAHTRRLFAINMTELYESELKEKVDYIISLGGSCAAGLQIKRRKLRTCSFPFDWFYIKNCNNFIKFLIEFKNDFENSFKVENLIEMKEKGQNKYDYQDKISGYNFVHTFKHDKDDIKNLKKDEYKIKRRLKRLYDTKKNKVVFVLSLNFDIEDRYIEELSQIIQSKWDNAKLYVIIFDANENREVSKEEYHIWKLARKENLYDYFETNWVWKFLDNLVVDEYKHLFFWRQILYKKIYKGMKVILFPKIPTILSTSTFVFGLRFVLTIGRDKAFFREV